MRYLAKRFGPVSLVLFLFSLPLCAQNQPGKVEVINEIKHDESPALRDIPPAPPQGRNENEVRLNPRLPNPTGPDQIDTVVQGSPLAPRTLAAPTPGPSFDGIGVGLGAYAPCCAPPDTDGSVGPNHYVQIVNLDLAVFNKTGGLLFGPVPINTLWAGFTGGCEFNNDGDPIVLYDKIADRWLVSQFNITTLPYSECVAISTTRDPTGTYFRYEFSYGNVDFPDYPKVGVWPDAYYSTYNIFANGTTFSGSKVCAWDRSKMLTGVAATQQCFNTTNAYGGLLPSDLDGATLPPAGSPNYVVALDTTTTLVSWKFHVDWTAPANTTFTGPTPLTVAGYTPSCNLASRGACIPQGGTAQTLESLSDRLMYRLAYRNFGDHEAIVVNHAVEVGSGPSLQAGVRWYELRPTAGNLGLFQQGTYAPDANWRWMGSAAMDKLGNIAMGYSVSSSTVSPQIHYTGRLPADAPGVMTQGENLIINGGGSQLPSLARWGDYSSMSVDPVDDCTFWYTTEYLKLSGIFNWSTRIASFKLPGCGLPATPDFSLSTTPSSVTVTAGSSASYTENITRTGGFAGAVSLSIGGLPAGASGTFSPNPATGASSALTITTSSTTPPGSYVFTVTGTSTSPVLTRTSTATLVVNSQPTPDFSLSTTPSSVTVTQGSPASYIENITKTGGFTGSVSLSISGLPTGASGAFNPNPATGASSALTVTTSAATPAGSYVFTVTGTSTSPALTRTSTATLVVNSAPPAPCTDGNCQN